MKTPTKKMVYHVSVSPRAEQVLGQAKQQMGMTQIAFMERLLEWYVAQDPRIRTAILNPFPEVRKGLAKLVLEEMQANADKDFDEMPKFDALIDNDFTEPAAEPRQRQLNPKSVRSR